MAKRLKKNGMSVDEAISLAERRMAYEQAEPLEEGTKVKLNYDLITSAFGYEKRNERYKAFVEENKDKEFTVMYDEKHNSGKLVSLQEDETDPRWYWFCGDLIKVNNE